MVLAARSKDAIEDLAAKITAAGGKASAIAETPVQLFWPQDPALTFAIAEELAARGALESARTNLRRLNELYPRIHEFRYRLATLLVRLGLLESASAEFRELLEESPGDTEVLDLAMRTDKALGRDQEAAELLNRMILQDPLGIGAVSFGEQLRRQDRADQADKLIRRLMRWEELSGRTDIIVLSARIAIALGNFEEAGAILAALAAQDTSSVAVAQLAFDLGLATRDQVLIDKAVYALRPLAGRLAPDEMPRIAARYIEAGLYAELLELFDTTVDTVTNPSILVAYHDAQAYPEYLVKFRTSVDPGPHPHVGNAPHPRYRPNALEGVE